MVYIPISPYSVQVLNDWSTTVFVKIKNRHTGCKIQVIELRLLAKSLKI